MIVMHLLSSNKYSGAENVACQIINLVKDSFNCIYVSPCGDIEGTLHDKNIMFYGLTKMSVKEVKRAIKEIHPDIIHAHDPRAITLAAMATRNIRIIAHVHNNRPDFKKASIWSIVFNWACKRKNTKHIFWVSDAAYDDYYFAKRSYIRNKSQVLYNVVDINYLTTKANMAENKTGYDVLYIGRFTYQKNPQRLISIASELIKQNPSIKIGLIGSGELLDECKKMVEDLKIDKNVDLLGFMDNAYGVLANSKIFLMSSRYEGTPMVILEAQSFGLPVVTTDLTELHKVVIDDQTGCYYQKDDEATNIILSLLHDFNKYKNLSQSTLLFSQKYNDLQKYKQTILASYN